MKTVVEVPKDIFDGLIEGLKKIDKMDKALEVMKISSPVDWLTVEEFLVRCKISRWKFEMWKDAGILNMKKIGKKWYIHPGEVQRFFNNELILPK